MPFFLIPAFAALATTATTATAATVAAQLVTGATIVGGGILAGKALHNAGRRKGQAEGRTSLAAEIQAQRMRLDEMEAGL